METIYLGEGVYRSAKDTRYFEVYTEEQMGKMADGKGGFSGVKVIGKTNKFDRVEYENYKHPAITDKQRAVIDYAKSLPREPKKLSPEEKAEYGLRSTTVYDYSRDGELAKKDGLPKKIGGGHNDWDNMIDTGEEEEEFNEDFIEAEEENVKSDGNRANDSGSGTSSGSATGGNKPKKPTKGKSANRKSSS